MLRYGAAMPTVVQVPSQFTYGALYAFTSQVVGPDGFPRDNHFTFDFAHLAFIDGSGLTVFSNTLEWLHSHKAAVYFTNHNRPHSASICYLDDCGFFSRNIGQSLRSFARVRPTTLPFMRVDQSEAFSWLENNFTPWMSGVLSVPSGALGSIRACVGEVFNNIPDHSTETIGFAHIQHYPNVKNVRITVSDFGRGIPNSIRAALPGLSDADAILKATEEGFTSQSTPRNRGMGLDTLIRCVTSNEGNVSIYSFSGALTCWRNSDGTIFRHTSQGSGAYPGTLVDISLKTDKFVGDEFEEEEMIW